MALSVEAAKGASGKHKDLCGSYAAAQLLASG